MPRYVRRHQQSTIQRKLRANPAVALLGPRQCGKSTLARMATADLPNVIHLDLERPSDLARLTDPEAFFEANRGRLICLDEIQRAPEIFPVMRAVMDAQDRPGQFLILGSASQALISQSSESLAGRISYIELTPFLFDEVPTESEESLRRYWLRGGYPRSQLAEDDRKSYEWRQDFIRTFLERDLPQLGITTRERRMERFWQMAAHSHGQLLNASKLGSALDVSYQTIRSYCEVLEQTFVLRLLPPFEVNLKKRLVKAPRLYIRDSGLLHALLHICDQNSLFGHPIYGASWEGLVIEQLLSRLPEWTSGFYRTQAGAEIDLILEKGSRRVAIECKASSAPAVSRGLWSAVEDLQIEEIFIVAPVKEPFPLRRGAWVVPLSEVVRRLEPLGFSPG